jgi:hypothetical protein
MVQLANRMIGPSIMDKQHQSAYRISLAFIWLRSGGTFALFLLLAAGIVSLFEGLPAYAPPLIWSVPLGMASIATARMVRISAIDRKGVPIEGTLINKEKRIGSHGDGSRTSRTRYVFTYTFDDAEHTGKSSWGLQVNGVPPSIGNRIGLLVDPDNPSRAIMVDEQPVRPPPIADQGSRK